MRFFLVALLLAAPPAFAQYSPGNICPNNPPSTHPNYCSVNGGPLEPPAIPTPYCTCENLNYTCAEELEEEFHLCVYNARQAACTLQALIHSIYNNAMNACAAESEPYRSYCFELRGCEREESLDNLDAGFDEAVDDCTDNYCEDLYEYCCTDGFAHERMTPDRKAILRFIEIQQGELAAARAPFSARVVAG